LVATAVLALGGNALIRQQQRGTHDEQYATALAMARSVNSLIRNRWRVVIVHGNGPQVGNLTIQQEESAELVPALPLSTLVAMTQGQLGSLICLALNEVSAGEAIRPVSIVTHIEVNSADPALEEPTKPIGPFFGKQEADALRAQRGWNMVEDSGRGYRRVVPSPQPLQPVEAEAISQLVDLGYTVVTAGGGGIPVATSAGDTYRTVEAVIDKDFAAKRIAEAVGATALVMVTDVPSVRLDFGTPHERAAGDMTATQAREHLKSGQFPPGSMGPKVQAAIEFVEACPSGIDTGVDTRSDTGSDTAASFATGAGNGVDRSRISVITSPELAFATLNDSGDVHEGSRGTRIVPDPQ